MLHLSCVVHGPIYGHFMGCTENGLNPYIEAPDRGQREKTVYSTTHKAAINRTMNRAGEILHTFYVREPVCFVLFFIEVILWFFQGFGVARW